MRSIKPVLTLSILLILSTGLLSCGGKDEMKTEPPPAGSIETEVPSTSVITVGDGTAGAYVAAWAELSRAEDMPKTATERGFANILRI